LAQFNINSDKLVWFTNELEKMHRSKLPNAVRNTLNNAAFDLKKKQVLLSAKSEFTERRKNFFKASSRVERAKGFNIRSMSSLVGFIPFSEAVENLQQQEYGGKVKKRSFVPMDPSRTSKSRAKLVARKNQLGRIRNIDKIQDKKKFRRVIASVGKGGHVLYKDTLFTVKTINRKKVKLTPLYSYKQGREVSVKPTGFMRKASLMSANKMETFFLINARKQMMKK